MHSLLELDCRTFSNINVTSPDCSVSKLVRLHLWQFTGLMVKLHSSNGANNNLTYRAFHFRKPIEFLHHLPLPRKLCLKDLNHGGGFGPLAGENRQIEGGWDGNVCSRWRRGVNSRQVGHYRTYSNIQGYTPLGHLLVLLVFILSLVVIFGLMWYFVSIFSPLLFDILEHFSSILTFFIIKSLTGFLGKTKYQKIKLKTQNRNGLFLRAKDFFLNSSLVVQINTENLPQNLYDLKSEYLNGLFTFFTRRWFLNTLYYFIFPAFLSLSFSLLHHSTLLVAILSEVS